VWACTVDLARWRRQAGLRPLAGYRELCRELALAGPGTFGELDSTGARSVLRRYSDAWFTAAARRKAGVATARYPRRRRHLMPVRYYHADRQGLLVSGRAIRAESYLHLADVKRRARVTARRAPKPGQAGPRRWKKTRARQRKQEAAHKRRVAQAQHEAAAAVIAWAVARRVGTLTIGDPRGVLDLGSGRRHDKRVRDWRIGRLLRALCDKAGQAGITAVLVDERGTSSTCPSCARRVPKPSGRAFSCPYCGFTGQEPLTRCVSPARRDPRRRSHHSGIRGSPGRPRPAPPGRGDVARLPPAAGREDRLTPPGQPGRRQATRH
jgi:predicted RNA-binding Zn-ribbon protein involved in translation (DUF1610 family)